MKTYDTTLIESLKFRAHGSIEISKLDEQIVVYKAQGPFNSELANALIDIERQAYAELSAAVKAWGDICYFVDSCLALEAAIECYQSFLVSCKQQNIGPSVSAFIYPPDVEGRLLAEPSYKKLFELAGIKYQGFTHFDDGLKWVRHQLSTLPN